MPRLATVAGKGDDGVLHVDTDDGQISLTVPLDVHARAEAGFTLTLPDGDLSTQEARAGITFHF